MPYEIKRVVDGYKVCKQADMKTCFSKRGLPYDNALRQMRAIIISEKGLYDPNYKKKSSKKTSKKISKKKTSKKKISKKISKKNK